MEAVTDGHKASDFHQTAINGPKLTQKKGKHSQHSREVSELIPLGIVRIRFAALGGIWITNRQLGIPDDADQCSGACRSLVPG
jgi:hypothetical protein